MKSEEGATIRSKAVAKVRWRRALQCGVVLLFLGPGGFSQTQCRINMARVSYRKVREFIVSHRIDSMADYQKLKPSWTAASDSGKFRAHNRKFLAEGNLQKVWGCYLKAKPSFTWNGRFVRYGLLISKPDNRVAYSDDSCFNCIEPGQVYFLDLRIIKGLLNVPVAFEIITVDSVHKVIEFSYIEGNVTQGKQMLHFADNGKGQTLIYHSSYFRSDSPLRDRVYPYFHTRIIREYHRNMRHYMKLVLDTPMLARNVE